MAADARGAETDVDIAIDIDRHVVDPISVDRVANDAAAPPAVPEVEEQTATVIDLRTAEPIKARAIIPQRKTKRSPCLL